MLYLFLPEFIWRDFVCQFQKAFSFIEGFAQKFQALPKVLISFDLEFLHILTQVVKSNFYVFAQFLQLWRLKSLQVTLIEGSFGFCFQLFLKAT